MEDITLKVGGMSCQHCVSAITQALMDLGGMKEVDVSLERGTVHAQYEEDKVTLEKIKNAIEDIGYVIE